MEFCVYCMKDVDIRIEERDSVETLKGVEVKYREKVAYCKECNKEVFVDSIENENMQSFYAAYRKQQGIISLDDVIKLSNKYNISKRNFSLLLGWGDHTFENYCDGYIPTKQYSDELIACLDKDYFLKKLESYKDSIPVEAYNKAKKDLMKVTYRYYKPIYNNLFCGDFDKFDNADYIAA